MPQTFYAGAALLFAALFALAGPHPTAVGATVALPSKNLSEDLNLPEHFRQLLDARAVIDKFQIGHYRVQVGGTSAVVAPLLTGRNRVPESVRAVRSEPAEAVAKYRSGFTGKAVPPRGYRAPILDHASALPSWPGRAGENDELLRTTSALVHSRLARDGLISTLAQLATLLGPQRLLTSGPAVLKTLEASGYPADLLASFSSDTHAAMTNRVLDVVTRVARRVSDGALPNAIRTEFDVMPFRFSRASPGYRVAEEDGRHELGLVRMQAGGGYRDGIVPGGSLDAIQQIVAAAPNADFLISVPADIAEPFLAMARDSWRLRRPGQAVIVAEPTDVAAWAQDNGKAGTIEIESPAPARAATLAPRYACIDEGHSTFEPAESFLMDGLRSAGHAVVQSSLLFQGGNLLAARDPASGKRILFVGEGEIYRNIALGLSRAQTLESFRAEFGVDRVEVIPAVSYHLDFDLCVRAGTNGMTLFINDTLAAIRIILDLGVDAFQRFGSLGTNEARAARADLAAGRDAEALIILTDAVRRARGGRAEYPAALAKYFAPDRVDSPAGNLQCFLLALDLLQASVPGQSAPPMDPGRREYLQALQRMEAARQRQTEALQKLGWTIVKVPSMPDLFRSINYLNGIHHRGGYLLPAFKGFYAPLDQAAAAVFARALGPDLRIAPIHTAECQRQNGGVHCVASVYPKL